MGRLGFHPIDCKGGPSQEFWSLGLNLCLQGTHILTKYTRLRFLPHLLLLSVSFMFPLPFAHISSSSIGRDPQWNNPFPPWNRNKGWGVEERQGGSCYFGGEEKPGGGFFGTFSLVHFLFRAEVALMKVCQMTLDMVAYHPLSHRRRDLPSHNIQELFIYIYLQMRTFRCL